MDLHTLIEEKLLGLSQDSLLKNMGYQNLKTGKQTLLAFLASENIYEWLKYGHYDLKYNSEQFVWKLVKILNIPKDIANEDIEEAKKRYKAFTLMKSFIWVETDIKEASSGFAMMAKGAASKIAIDKESLISKPKHLIFLDIKNIIIKHYADNKGTLHFDEIKYYLYTHTDGKTYKLTTEGIPFLEKKE
ncbi:MAG: hypothetical protein DRQ78_13455 [Epsilonproteobacteria bacterium]|nr:MAG: hypothetical protein DRQ78_13455 [Campylobacterota bacterium]